MASTTYDPFTWRLAELEALAAQPYGGDVDRRRELEDDLLIAEAEDLAHGRRRLTHRSR
jgi:hypothetical protein